MFTVASFPIANMWKQIKCSSMDAWTKMRLYIYTMEYYSAINNEILPFSTTQMDLEGVMLSAVNQTRTVTTYDLTCMWNLKNKTNETRTRLLNTDNEWVIAGD